MQNILRLGRRIAELVEACRPANFHRFGLMMANELTEEEHELLHTMEQLYGEKRCNVWMCNVLASTSVFIRIGEEVVNKKELNRLAEQLESTYRV